MKITLESTDVVVTLREGLHARLWQGRTEGGTPIVAAITLLATREDDDESQLLERLAVVIKFPVRRER